MRHKNFTIFVALTTLLFSLKIFALPCLNGQGIFDRGNTIDDFQATCGKPISSADTTKNVPVSEKWQYYVANNMLNGNNGTVTLFFRDNILQTIHTKSYENKCTSTQTNTANSNTQTTVNCTPIETNVTSTGFCGDLIQIGNNTQFVISACKNPASRETLEEKTVTITTLKYNDESPNTFIFTDGSLTEWH